MFVKIGVGRSDTTSIEVVPVRSRRTRVVPGRLDPTSIDAILGLAQVAYAEKNYSQAQKFVDEGLMMSASHSGFIVLKDQLKGVKE